MNFEGFKSQFSIDLPRIMLIFILNSIKKVRPPGLYVNFLSKVAIPRESGETDTEPTL